MIRFLLNDLPVELERPAGELLLDALRGPLGNTGVKQGCREGDCGACGILVGEPDGDALSYRAMPSCMMLLGHARGRHIVTIEGLNLDESLSPVQQAVAEEGATQCGFCTPGVVVSLTGSLCGSRPATEAELLESVGGNICRCTGYMSFRRAARRLTADFEEREADSSERIATLVREEVLPAHFAGAPQRLRSLMESREAPDATTSQEADYAIAGGTDCLVQRRTATEVESPHFFPSRSLESRSAEEAIRWEAEHCVLEAWATFEDLKQSPVWREIDPRAVRNMDLVASQLIRERATLGGNIANASPIADGVSCLLALDTELELEGPAGSRRLPLDQYFQGYKQTALAQGERIRRLRVARGRQLASFEKVSRRERLDIATVNTSACFERLGGRLEGVRISAGGVGPIPMLLRATADHLEGQELTSQRLREALEIAGQEVTPISDVRGSAAYKRVLLRQLVLAHFIERFPGEGFEELMA